MSSTELGVCQTTNHLLIKSEPVHTLIDTYECIY